MKQLFVNNSLKGETTYPLNIDNINLLLKGYNKVGGGIRKNNNSSNTRHHVEDGVAFTTVSDKRTFDGNCCGCGKKGNFMRNYRTLPESEREEICWDNEWGRPFRQTPTKPAATTIK